MANNIARWPPAIGSRMRVFHYFRLKLAQAATASELTAS
jgi:hypothetical protein